MTRKPTPTILDDVLSTHPATTVKLSIDQIKTDGGTQMRAGLHEATVLEYLEAMAPIGWSDFPPIIVYHDGRNYWLADGFHRIEAYRRAAAQLDQPADRIPADVRAGTRRDAILYAAGANAQHGLRRTNADKRRAVEVLLRDDEWRQWSDREIGRRCDVSDVFVGKVRREMTANGLQSPAERTGADGRTINTANIGTARPATPPYEPPHVQPQTRIQPGSPQAKALTAEVKAATWADQPLKQPARFAEVSELERSLAQWAQPLDATVLRGTAHTRGGALWWEARNALQALNYGDRQMGINYRDRDLVAALHNLASQKEQRVAASPIAQTIAPTPAVVVSAESGREGEGETQFDAWTLAWAGGARATVNEAEQRLKRLAAAMEPWVLAWTDDKGRTWRDVVDRNPQHANSPFRQDLASECKRRGLWIADSVLASVITQVFSNLAREDAPSAVARVAPAGKLLTDWTDEDWAAYGQAAAQAAAEPITDPVKGIVVDGAEQRAIDAAKRIAEATPRGWTATPAPAVEVVTERGVELAAPEDDDRHGRLKRWWVRLMSMQNDLLDWGNLTGRHLATGETERGLRRMLEITQRELDLLEGREVEGEEYAL
jgi:hypothetical protein